MFFIISYVKARFPETTLHSDKKTFPTRREDDVSETFYTTLAFHGRRKQRKYEKNETSKNKLQKRAFLPRFPQQGKAYSAISRNCFV